ncbi:MAG: HAD-IA family hydrolase [Clostridia bacterium]|nr:HAD-IA family hydrolase [Clostridia bacterium]
MKNKEIIFFDLDGTITDSKKGIFNSIKYVLDFYKIEERDENILIKFLGPPLKDSFMKYFNMSEKQAIEAVAKYREYYRVKGIFELSVYDGAEEMLKKLKENGKTVCLATSKPQEFAESILKRHDLLKYFDFLAGATMDEKRNEKDLVIKYAIEQNSFNKEKIVMIGDRENDILGAKINGIDSIGVLYGYGDEEELKKAGCKSFAKSTSEVTDLLI